MNNAKTRKTNTKSDNVYKNRDQIEQLLAVLDEPTCVVDGFIVNTQTGEILASYEPMPAAEQIRYKYIFRSPDEMLSVDEWAGYMTTFVDRRKLPPFSNAKLYSEQDAALGVQFRQGVDCRISKPMMTLLLKLQDLVMYRNVILLTQAELACHLDVTKQNLLKTLSKLECRGMLRVYTSRDGVRKGEIKLLLNPRVVFRGYDTSRDAAIDTWYKPNFNTVSHMFFEKIMQKVA